MKLPKTILLCGRLCKIITDSKTGGGWFTCDPLRICVGTDRPERIPEIFLHEVIEAILTIRDNRYILQKGVAENGSYLFSFNHKEYEMAIKDMVLAFKNVKF